MDVEGFSTQQRRLSNVAAAQASVRRCLRHHRVSRYLAGQVAYNLGEYPRRFSCRPSEYDNQLLRELAEHGVKVIHVHEEWNDSLRRLGADKHTPHDPNGLRAFVDLVHSLGMKITLYISTGYLDVRDPDFRPEWTDLPLHLVDFYFKYAMCSPASPGWRAYLLPRLRRILEEFGSDGFYNDMGYIPRSNPIFTGSAPLPEVLEPLPPAVVRPSDAVNLGQDSETYSPGLEDLLGIVMDMAHDAGGIIRLHAGADQPPPCREKVYDYLWVGESVTNLDSLRRAASRLDPYVVPCLDLAVTTLQREDDLYLHAIPYLQFPLRCDGRPGTGERAMIEDVEYPGGEARPNTLLWRRIWRERQAHPDGYPSFGAWDSCPGRPRGRERWLHHLDLYLPMVSDGTHVWIQIEESNLFRAALPEGLVASLFANEQMYLVLANYTDRPIKIATSSNWRDRERGDEPASEWTIPAHDLLFLIKA